MLKEAIVSPFLVYLLYKTKTNIMNFFRCTKNYKFVKEGQIVCDSMYHWYKTPILATTNEKHIIYPEKIEGLTLKTDYFKPLTYSELNKIKPHLNKTLYFDYDISERRYKLSLLSNQCCYECGVKVFGEKELNYYSSIGKCYTCGEEKVKLYNKNQFICK